MLPSAHSLSGSSRGTRRSTPSGAALCALVLGALLAAAAPARADWLVTVQGQLIETQGSWQVADGRVTYTDLAGEARSLPVAEVDLEGSYETTALKSGKKYVPRPAPTPTVTADRDADRRVGEPKITLYMTSWCGYCRKTSQLLDRLDADYVEKNIERDRKAAAEYRRKAQGHRGVPVIDIDGTVVRGFNEQRIRQLVKELKQREREAGAA